MYLFYYFFDKKQWDKLESESGREWARAGEGAD